MNREERFIAFFSHLTPQTLGQIKTIFATEARFKDPFNDVNGVDAITNVFDHMFSTTEQPTFIVNQYASNNQHLFLQWDFMFIKDKQEWKIEGSSMVRFNDDDAVEEHIDYWDPAEQIYSNITGLRVLMKFLRSKLTAN